MKVVFFKETLLRRTTGDSLFFLCVFLSSVINILFLFLFSGGCVEHVFAAA